jgi:hypothetical protein
MNDDERDTLPPSAESHIPGPARLPSLTERIDPIVSLTERVGDLSDALHAPDGPVHLLISGLAEKGAKRELRAQRRHRQVMKTLAHIANELASLNQTVKQLVPEQQRHAALLQLVTRGHGAAE